MYVCIRNYFRGNSTTTTIKNSPIKIVRAYIHILRNNPATFHNSPMERLGVADKGLLHVCVGWF